MNKITAYFAKACSIEERTAAEIEKPKSLGITGPPLFTRHFYNQSEVIAALKYALINKKHEEAAFWCLELTDSAMYDELLEAIFEVYILHALPTNKVLHGFIEQVGNFTVDGTLWLCIDVCNCIDVKDEHEKTVLDVDIIQWCRGDGGDWFDAINGSAEEYISRVYNGVSYYHRNKEILITQYIPQFDVWIKATGRCARRCMAIPVECRRTVSNLGELNGLRLQQLEGCPFYDELFELRGLSESMLRKKEYRIVDEAEEELLQELYAEIFPDDIPDEWSLSDKCKSHNK
jgi:hypothetical protein